MSQFVEREDKEEMFSIGYMGLKTHHAKGLPVKWSLALPNRLPKTTLYVMALEAPHIRGMDRGTFHKIGGDEGKAGSLGQPLRLS